MKYGLDMPFGIFKQVPRQSIPVGSEDKIESFSGICLAIEEDDSFPDPLS